MVSLVISLPARWTGDVRRLLLKTCRRIAWTITFAASTSLAACDQPVEAYELGGFEFVQGGQWYDPNDVGSALENIFAITPNSGWPPRPWLWSDVTHTNSNDGNVEIGVKVSGFGAEAGLTHKISFDTGHMSHAVFVTTMTSPSQQMTRFDDEAQSVRFNILEGVPMVGVCIYSSWLSVSSRTAARLNMFGSGLEVGETISDTVKRSTHSHVFPIDPTKTPSHYIREVCDRAYKEKVRPAVVADLKNLAYDVLVYSNPEDSCLPPSGAPPATGDPTCADWHRQMFPSVTAWTVPRCLPDSAGNHRCVLRSKTGNSCPLYRDESGKLYAYRAQGSKLITNPSFSYRCDSVQGLSCYQTKADGWFSYAESECR